MNPMTLEILAREHHQHLLWVARQQRCAHLARPFTFKWPWPLNVTAPAAPSCATC